MRSILTAVLIAAAFAPTFAAGTAEEKKKKLGTFVITYYWVIDESSSRYDGKRATELLDRRGKVIAVTHSRFRRDLVMEGTGWLRDGRTVTYAGRVGLTHRFRVIRSRYGITATGCPTKPYRTAAVDPRFVKLGSKIYIPELKGTKLPDGSVHDGVFTANDRGHFRGSKVDVFVGAGPTSTRPFIRKGYRSRSRVTLYLEGTTVRRCG